MKFLKSLFVNLLKSFALKAANQGIDALQAKAKKIVIENSNDDRIMFARLDGAIDGFQQ